MRAMRGQSKGKVLFVSLGCDKNLVDSEYMLGALGDAGYELTDEEQEADAIIVNTCCFIGDAKEESVNTLLEMAAYKDAGSCKALIAAGCLAQRYQDEIMEEIPQVDALIGTNSQEEILRALEEALHGRRFREFKPLEGLPWLGARRQVTGGGHYAYLKIAEGCDKNCTYCVIPKVRGPYRSVPMEDLLAQAGELARGGVKELILVAQETTVYGMDLYGKKSLPDLLDGLNGIPGLAWIRILYCYPEEIDDALIAAIKRNPKVCHYLDIPVQHICDGILRRMGRRATGAGIRAGIAHLREEIPDIALRTTLICGFPGETQEMHEELMRFVNEAEFERLGVFPYSREEGTVAAKFAGQVEEEQKQAWKDEVMELQEEIIFDQNEGMKGRELVALVEGKAEDEGVYVARTYRDAPDVDGYLFLPANRELMTGDMVKARVTAAYGYDLMGVVCDEFTK